MASAASAPASPTLLTVAGGRRAPGHQPDGPDGKRGTDVRAQPRRSGEGCWLCRVHRGLPSPALPGAKARSLLLSPHHTWWLSLDPPRRAQWGQAWQRPSLPRVPPSPRPHLCGGRQGPCAPGVPAPRPCVLRAALSRDLCVCHPHSCLPGSLPSPEPRGTSPIVPPSRPAEETMSPECICMSIMLPLCTWEFLSREQ